MKLQEMLQALFKKGLIKYLGFCAHSEEAAIALMDMHDFTSILFPFNWVLWLFAGKRILNGMQKRNKFEKM